VARLGLALRNQHPCEDTNQQGKQNQGEENLYLKWLKQQQYDLLLTINNLIRMQELMI
jgi:hypothetical protein